MKKPAPNPLLSFRVYPEDRFLYAVVNIWPTKKAMYAHKPLDRKHLASCTGQQRLVIPPRGSKSRVRKRGEFAELNFFRGSLGVEVVSHEFTHAAFCWADRRKLNLALASNPDSSQSTNGTLEINSVEERFCYALGRMVNQFTSRLYDNGLYKEVVSS
jgi:hypothetical protein